MRLRTRGRFNVKRWTRVVADRVAGTPFDRALSHARRNDRRTFVFGWNRGLGDIALGLYPLFARIRATVTGSRIIVFTRADLADAFRMTGADAVHVVAGLERGVTLDPHAACAVLRVKLPQDAVLFADPDPTRWLFGRRREFPPSLRWDPRWNAKADTLVAAGYRSVTIGAHVSSETAQYYGYVKDWPAAAWRELFARFPNELDVRWLLFGNDARDAYGQRNVVDLRGRTDFVELLAVIRSRCRILVAPDSGVLTAAYYLADDFPIDIVSLWSDPRQGVLKQDCASPNPRLVHVPLVGRDDDVRNVAVDDVAHAVSTALSRCKSGAGRHDERRPRA